MILSGREIMPFGRDILIDPFQESDLILIVII